MSTTTLTHRRGKSSEEDHEVLSKLAEFIHDLETRLSKVEHYAALTHVDESFSRAYTTLVEIRDGVIGEGRRAAEAFVSIVETQYQDLFNSSANTTTGQKALESLHYLEKKLADIEQACVDNSMHAVHAADQLNKSVQRALLAARNRLLTYDELPKEWQENPYILRGYRFCHKYTDCVASMTAIHNETCNIWTHLLGFIVMVLIAFFHWPTTLSWQDSTAMDKFTMVVFLIAAMKCLVCSTVWHTFNGISHIDSMKRFACVDYTGITVLIASSILTTEYAAFYCRPISQATYMIVTALCGIGGALFTWHPSFEDGKTKRVAFFVSFAIAGFSSFIHAALLHGWVQTFWFFFPVLKSLMCYAVGVVVYSLLIPERWCPGGIFDYFGMSHNLWHVSVFGGIYYHYLATISLIEGAKEFSCSLA